MEYIVGGFIFFVYFINFFFSELFQKQALPLLLLIWIFIYSIKLRHISETRLCEGQHDNLLIPFGYINLKSN